MFSFSCRRLLQVRNYKTVRVTDGLSHLREDHKRERQMSLDKQNEEKRLRKEAIQLKKEEERIKAASVPPLVSFKLSCPGCGAKYQHEKPEKAGYLEYSTMMSWDAASSLPCDRCEKVSDSEYHQMYSISEMRFSRLLQKISQTKSLGVIVCDILGFPSSLPPDLSKIYPPGSPIILCLNKCDILANSGGQMNIIEQYYRPHIEKWEKQNKLRFNEIVFSSGRTGTGLPELALHIQQYIHGDKYRKDLDFCYLLGITNAGKSTLFNKLSPLVNNKIKCIGNVTESPLPGTTVSNISSIIQPPPKITKRKNRSVDQLLDRKVSKLENLVAPSETPPDLAGTSHSTWFKSRIDQQLMGTNGEKMLMDTPGVLANDSIPEAVFACQHKIYNQTIELDPGSCLSFGWYKVYYVRGSVSLKLGINMPSVINHEIISEPSDSSVGFTDSGVELCNKLYVMNGNKSRAARNYAATGDISLGNVGWISVHLTSEDDVTVLVFGPRLEDIHYRTPGFHFKVPKLHHHRVRNSSSKKLGQIKFDVDGMYDD